jgi:hypothetical protein
VKPPKNRGKGRDKWTLKGKHPKHVHVLNQSDTKNAIETQTPQLYFDSLIINSVNHKNTQNTQALVDIQVDSGQTTRNIVCKIDTGAEGNVIPLDLYTQLHPHSLYNYSGHPVDWLRTPSSTNITAFACVMLL